jgi:hypothetical protein
MDEALHVAAVEIARELRIHDVQGEIAGFLYLMSDVFPFLAAITVVGTPVACLRRTRSIAGALIAAAIALTVIFAGELAVVMPDPWRICLVILLKPGWVARLYVEPQWCGALVTMVQIVLGVVLLNSFRRPRPLLAAAGKSSPPPAPSPTGDGENENA